METKNDKKNKENYKKTLEYLKKAKENNNFEERIENRIPKKKKEKRVKSKQVIT